MTDFGEMMDEGGGGEDDDQYYQQEDYELEEEEKPLKPLSVLPIDSYFSPVNQKQYLFVNFVYLFSWPLFSSSIPIE